MTVGLCLQACVTVVQLQAPERPIREIEPRARYELVTGRQAPLVQDQPPSSR